MTTFPSDAEMCLHRPEGQTTRAHAMVLYSGPGGASLGLHQAGVDTYGVENDPDAAATAIKAGLPVVQADVTELDPTDTYRDTLAGATGPLILQASPPCPGFSKAGGGAGRRDLPAIADALDELTYEAPGERQATALARRIFLDAECSDHRSALTLDPARWVAALHPDYVMLEQVREVLPVWEAYRTMLRAWGYSCWAGLVHSEQFGVPQTRTRAFLLASRRGPVYEPTPSRSRYNNRSPWRLDPGLPRWVSMAEALGWGSDTIVTSNYGTTGVSSNRGVRTGDQPAATITSKAGRNVVTHLGDVRTKRGTIRHVTEPAPTLSASLDNGNTQWFSEDHPPPAVVDRDLVWRQMESGKVDGLPRVNNQSGTLFDLAWPADRPAPAIAGRALAPMPGGNANRFNGRTKSRNDGLRITVSEAATLQTFPDDWPWQGGKTSQYTQVGNAVPPLLQRELTTELMRRTEP